MSRLAWDAWIETLDVFIEDGMTRVASRMGRVDWNNDENISDFGSNRRVSHGTRGLKLFAVKKQTEKVRVASRMGRVDWNLWLWSWQ